jgi:hypothetical protein
MRPLKSGVAQTCGRSRISATSSDVAEPEPDGTAEVDIEEMLRRIHAGAEHGRRMAELRPSREQIKVNLETYRDRLSDYLDLLTGPQVESSVDFGTRDHFMTTD